MHKYTRMDLTSLNTVLWWVFRKTDLEKYPPPPYQDYQDYQKIPIQKVPMSLILGLLSVI